jgi:moderate conductance mechanosensitive channel
VALPALALGGLSAKSAAAAGALDRACGRAPGIACRTAWDLTHNLRVAQVTGVYLAGPIGLALRVGYVLLLAFILRAAARRLIIRLTARAAAGQHSSERRSQRASALASVLSNAASVTIFTIAIVIILGDMGLNLAPLLASAGVLGVAIGFGAQNLVKDFLAGIFLLLEDQYGVGDVVNASGVVGTVEAVSLRITRLRDVNGVVWNIRNGTIERAGNETHGWARAVVDFPVPAAMPVAAARTALERAAVGMWEEPAWQHVILDRPQVWGVQDVSAERVLIRVAARTAPQGKLEVARELRERLKTAIDAEPPGPGPDLLPDAVPRQPEPPDA